MSTSTDQSSTPNTQGDTVRPEAPATSGPVTRIVAGSLATGAVLALVLMMVVFAGGTESIITGSALTGFAAGWALLATLTTRYTSRPQRWAVVPAAVMGGSGLALLVLTPDNAAMTRLAWVWPPVMLVMAVWMFLRMRRSLPRGGRVLLTPVFALLAIASVGATYENVGLSRDQGAYPAPGRLYDVGGQRLHLDCRGDGGPTVVLFNGMGEVSASWARITGSVARTNRVCAYDRAGQGWSDDAQHPQDGVEAARELHALLAEAGEEGPFVLAGHSIGGPYAMTYAARYPAQVAGLVLLDSSSPEQYSKIPSYAGQYAVMRRGLAIMPSLNRFGLGRLLPASPLQAPAAEQVKALSATARGATNSRDELTVVLDTFEQSQALTTLGDRPVVVLTASENLSTDGWGASQDRMAALSINHVHRTVNASHMGMLEDPAPAAASARAITEVVHAARTGTPVDLD